MRKPFRGILDLGDQEDISLKLFCPSSFWGGFLSSCWREATIACKLRSTVEKRGTRLLRHPHRGPPGREIAEDPDSQSACPYRARFSPARSRPDSARFSAWQAIRHMVS